MKRLFILFVILFSLVLAACSTLREIKYCKGDECISFTEKTETKITPYSQVK